MKKSAYYSDLIFTFCLVSFSVLFLLRSFKIPLVLALILAIICGISGSYLLFLRLNKKQKLFALKKSEEEEKNSLCFYLKLASENETNKFFKSRLPFLLNELSPTSQQEQTNELHEQTDTNHELFLNGYAFFPIFRFSDLSGDDIANLYPEFKNYSTPVILCDGFSSGAQTLTEKLGVILFDGNQLYRALKKHDAIPSEFPVKTVTPVKRKRRNIAFAKSNSRRFFSSGAILLLSSVFIPYSVYYIIVGCILLITAVLVRIFGYR